VLCPDCREQLGSISSEAQALRLIQQHGSSELGFLQFFNLHRTQALIAGEAEVLFLYVTVIVMSGMLLFFNLHSTQKPTAGFSNRPSRIMLFWCYVCLYFCLGVVMFLDKHLTQAPSAGKMLTRQAAYVCYANLQPLLHRHVLCFGCCCAELVRSKQLAATAAQLLGARKLRLYQVRLPHKEHDSTVKAAA
jgi:hypothetical protein